MSSLLKKFNWTDSKGEKYSISYDSYLAWQGKKPIGEQTESKEQPYITVGNFDSKYKFPIDVKKFGKMEYAEKPAEKTERFQLKLINPRYNPVSNEQDAKTIREYFNAENAYQREKAIELVDPKGIAKKYGLDASSITTYDVESYFANNFSQYGIIFKAVDGKPFAVGSNQVLVEEADYLFELGYNNERRILANKDAGALEAFAHNYFDGLTFGLAEYVGDKVGKKEYEAKGLNPDYFVSNGQAYAKTNDEHKIASISGNIAGTVTTSMGVGGLVKGGLKKLGVTFAKKWMEPAIVQGITSAVRGGVTEFSAGGDLKDISINALREGATGAIGGAVGSKVEGAISSALTNPKYANGILNTIKNTRATAITAQTISGVADAAADYATDNAFVGVANKLGANLEYRTGSDVVTDFAVSMVFGFGNKLNTKNSAQLPVKISDYLDNYDLYRRIVKGNGDLEVKINAGKDLVASGNEISRFLDDNIFTGQKDTVDLLKNSIEVVNDTVNISNKIFETELKTNIKLKGFGQTLDAKYNNNTFDVDLAIGNIIDGKATFEDFKLFAPENTANRQAFYEATGLKLPNHKNDTFLNLLYITNKNAIHRDFPTYFYNKHYGKRNFNLDLYLSEIYNKHISEIKDADNIQTSTEHIKTRNEKLEGKVHAVTSVPFVRKTITVNDKVYDVVVPEFDSLFDATISEDLYFKRDRVQFKECNRQLFEAVKSDSEVRKLFTEEQLEDILNGKRPECFTWHHCEETGKLQLVNRDIHIKTGHTGGRDVWGGGSKYR